MKNDDDLVKKRENNNNNDLVIQFNLTFIFNLTLSHCSHMNGECVVLIMDGCLSLKIFKRAEVSDET